MYHRVADQPIDPWGNAVSPAHFKEHLEVLVRTRRPLALPDFVRNVVAGTLPANAVALTFDDGYADNLVAAKPRLAAAGVPATVFLATGYLGRTGEFWWDELARLILRGAGPRNFETVILGETMRFNLEDERTAAEADWRAWLSRPVQPARRPIWRSGRPCALSRYRSAKRPWPGSERSLRIVPRRRDWGGR